VRVPLLVAALAALAAGATVALAAEGSGEAQAQLPAGLPRDIAGYERWTKLNFRPLPNRGGTAHHGVKRVYVNRSRAVLAPGGKQRFPYPNGTIVVKTGSEGGVVTLVAIGRKRRGTDRAHADWQFVEYTRSRAGERFGEIARGQVCYGCHVGARRTDWIFTPAD